MQIKRAGKDFKKVGPKDTAQVGSLKLFHKKVNRQKIRQSFLLTNFDILRYLHSLTRT